MHARDASLAAARARIRALETQLGLSTAAGASARGVAAVASSAELAATKAERDSLLASLEKAEKRAIVASRQQRSERDRRAALAATLKQKEEELQRRTQQREATSAAARILSRASDAESLEAAAAPHRIGCAILRSELASAEDLVEMTRESLQGDLFDALTRAAEAETALASELQVSKRMDMEDAEQRAAATLQRETELTARLKVAQEDSRTEARRAAALEAALAAEVEARRRDMQIASAEAEAMKAKFMELDRLERARLEAVSKDGAEQQAALAAELEAQAKLAEEAKAALAKAKAAHAANSHAALVLRVGARAIGTLGLRGMLHHWRSTCALLGQSKEAQALKEEARAMQGKLAMLKVQRQRTEEALNLDAKKAEEEVQRKLVLAQRKLDKVEERRRFLEIEMSSKNREVDAVRSELQPFQSMHLHETQKHEAALSALAREVKQAEQAAARHAKHARSGALRAVLSAASAARLWRGWRLWAANAAQMGHEAALDARLGEFAAEQQLRCDELAAEFDAAKRVAAAEAAAWRIQKAERARAHESELKAAEARASAAQAAAWERESALHQGEARWHAREARFPPPPPLFPPRPFSSIHHPWPAS